MRRFLATFLSTAVLAGLGWHAWRSHADSRLALESFQPEAPRPESWTGGSGRAARMLVARWSAAEGEPERLACLRALAYLSRSGESAALERIGTAQEDPAPALRRTAFFAVAWVFQPNARPVALTEVDWDALCRPARAALDSPDPEERLAAAFAFHVLSETRIDDLRRSDGRPCFEPPEVAEALVHAIAGPAPFPGLDVEYPAFLARCFFEGSPCDRAAARYVDAFRIALGRADAADDLLEALFAPVDRLPPAELERALVAALDSPRLAPAAVSKARGRPSVAYLPAYLRLLEDPGPVSRDEVARQLIALAQRTDDDAVGGALAGFLDAQGREEALPAVLHAIHEICGPREVERFCPEDLAALPAEIAVRTAGVLGRTSHAAFLERLIAAVRGAPDDRVRVAALDAVRSLARRDDPARRALAALLEELVDADPPILASDILLDHILDLDRVELAPAIERLLTREKDPQRLADLVDLRRPARLRQSLQEALAPVLADFATEATSRRVREAARASLERFDYPPEAAPLATRLGHAPRSDREQALEDFRRIGTLTPAEAAARLGELLAFPSGVRETCQILRSLGRLPADEEALWRARSLLASPDAYVTWRAALLLLRHDCLSDPTLTFEAVRTRMTSPIPGETYPDILRETVSVARRRGLLVNAAPPILVQLLRQGSEAEVAEAAEALLLIGSPEAADVARQAVSDRVPARTWAAAARILGALGESRDLTLLARVLGSSAQRRGPEDLALMQSAFVDAAEGMARPADVPTLIAALDAVGTAAATTRLIALLESLTGERFEGDLAEVRRAWRTRR